MSSPLFGDFEPADALDTDGPDPQAVLDWLRRRRLIRRGGRVPDQRRLVAELLEHGRREGWVR